MTPEEKLERYLKLFKEKHGDRYDYSMVRIDESIRPTYKQKVKVVCQEHGVFDVIIESHLNKRGCKFCGYKKARQYRRAPTKDLIKRLQSLHRNKYEYDELILESARTRDYVVITCKIHGDFKQKLGNHLLGKGCKNVQANPCKRIHLKSGALPGS